MLGGELRALTRLRSRLDRQSASNPEPTPGKSPPTCSARSNSYERNSGQLAQFEQLINRILTPNYTIHCMDRTRSLPDESFEIQKERKRGPTAETWRVSP